MAQFFTNFDEYPVGDVTTSGQTDWTPKISNGTSDYRIIDGGDQDGKFLRVQASGTNGSRVLAFNPLNGVSDNVEILVKFWIFKSGSTGTTGRFGAGYLRYGGTTEASTIGYAGSFLPVSSVKSVVLQEDSVGVVQFSNYAWNMSQDYFMRMKVSGNDRYMKIWTANTAEPGSWTLSSSATPPTIASPYSGVGTYQADSYLYVKQFSAGTAGDPAPMYVNTDKAQTGQFRVNVIPPTADVAGYGGGYGSVAGYGQGYATALYPTATISDKDQVGQFRVRTVNDKPQIGQFRVRKTFDQTQVGNFRVRQTYDKAQLGQFRVKKVLEKTQTGIFRVKKTFDNTQVGRFWVRTINDKAQVGAFRVASEPSRLQVGKFRVKVTLDRAQLGRFQIAAPTTRDQIGKFRVRRTYDVTQIGKFRTRVTLLKPQVGSFRVRVTNVKDITGQFRVSVKLDKTQIGKFRVTSVFDKNQVGNFRIIKVSDRVQTGKFRVKTTSTTTQVGRFLVRTTNDKHQTGRFRIEYLGIKPQVGKFRIYNKDTFEEVFVPTDQYIEDIESQGTLGTAVPETGVINEFGVSVNNVLEDFTVPDGGTVKVSVETYGDIRGNNEWTILMFEGDFWWMDETGLNIIVQEYGDDDIINLMPKKGNYKEGIIEYGEL